MKKFLCSYGYDGSFYLVFVENGVASVKKIGENYNDEARDLDIAKKVVSRIAELKYIFDHTFQYQGKTFNLYYNLFNERIYISRYENSKEVPCDYDEYKKLYDSFVTKVVCLRSDRNGPPRGWNKPQSRYNGSSGFGAYSNGPSTTYTPYKRKKGFRKIKVAIGAAIVTALVACSTALLTNCRGITFGTTVEESISHLTEKDNSSSIEEGDSTPTECDNSYLAEEDIWSEEKRLEEAITSNSRKYINDIREQLNKAGVEEWAIKSVVEQFCKEHDIQLQEDASINEEEPTTKTSEMLIKSIRDNDNLSYEDKKFYENRFAPFFNWTSKYMDDPEAVASRLNTLKIEYKDQDQFYNDLKQLEGEGEDDDKETNDENKGDKDDEKQKEKTRGFYVAEENKIEICKGAPAPETEGHEITHAIGSLGFRRVYSQLEEGFTELYNPTRRSGPDNRSYRINQTFAIIIEQIYGPDFIRECFFGSEELHTKLIERFSLKKGKYIYFLQDVNENIARLRELAPYIDEIKDNPEALDIVNDMMKDLKEAYTDLTGEKWEDNEALKICEARLRGKTNLTKGLKIADIAIGKGGEGYVCYLEGKEHEVELVVKRDNKSSWQITKSYTPVKEIDIE